MIALPIRLAGLVLLGCCLPIHAESACFRTAREAAIQSGVRDGEGFRLDGVRLDRVGGARWARVLSCQHPERPGLVLKVPDEKKSSLSDPAKPQVSGQPVVAIGAVVRVVRADVNVRLEMAGVAQESGAIGDAVRVRVGSADDARFVQAVVRGDGLVELEAAQ